MLVTSKELAKAFGVSRQSAHTALKKALVGRSWRGHFLPAVEVNTSRGGRSGVSYALRLDLCTDELQAMLAGAEKPNSSPASPPVPRPVEAEHIATARDRQHIIGPILSTKRGSPERARVIREIAGQPGHMISGRFTAVAERTLRDWVRAAEKEGAAGLLPRVRKDRGGRRVKITRAWDKGCGLPEDVQDEIADNLDAVARGLLKAGRSERSVRRLCSTRLQRMTAAAGAALPAEQLARLCNLNAKWSARFAEMGVVHEFQSNNKVFTDRHEFHVRRGLTRRPMEVLMGDVHTIDLTIAAALASNMPELRAAAASAAQAGEVSVKAWLIGWMDASSGYLWATPVITGPGQGITQQDVANSLYEVLTCPWGGMPDTFLVDNGGEFGFLVEAVTRFAEMAQTASQKIIKCRPYHPEGKARLEGAFNVLERGFVSALPGYNGGNILKPRLAGRGKGVAPYGRGPTRLIEDLHRAVELYNGTAQQGDLAGLSPKAMLSQKAAEAGWQAQQIKPQDAVMFDLVFSREERRDVRQGTVTIDGRRYCAPVLAEMIGEKQVPILVPFRDPTGPAILFRDGVIHQLTCEVFGVTDGQGALRKSQMVALQRAEIERRAAAAAEVDVEQMLADAADLGPVEHNDPASWSFGVIDKGGFLAAPVSEAEALARHDAEVRDEINEFIALSRAGRREAAGATADLSRAT